VGPDALQACQALRQWLAAQGVAAVRPPLAPVHRA
jgi:hypothetical protein